jgi:hypothetical protein
MNIKSANQSLQPTPQDMRIGSDGLDMGILKRERSSERGG